MMQERQRRPDTVRDRADGNALAGKVDQRCAVCFSGKESITDPHDVPEAHKTPGKVASAKLYATALGIYELEINGQKWAIGIFARDLLLTSMKCSIRSTM